MKTTANTKTTTRTLLLTLALAALPLLPACDGGDAAEATAPRPSNVDESLKRLGVPMTGGPRIGDPEGAGPFGRRATLQRADELFTLGFTVPPVPQPRGGAFVEFDKDPTVPAVIAAVDEPWSSGNGRFVRAVAAADIDGDGREETLVVSTEPGPNPSDVLLSVIEDGMANPPFKTSSVPIALRGGVVGLVAAAADFDGDEAPDLVVGVTSEVPVEVPATGSAPAATVMRARAELLFLHNDHGALALDSGATTRLLQGEAVDGPETASIVLAPGRLDADEPHELAVVVNTSRKAAGDVVYGARQLVFDDATTGYAQRAAGAIQMDDGVVVTMGDVATGDIDGDGLDEVIVGGVTAAYDHCDGASGKATASIAAVALDDAAHAFAPLGSTRFDRAWGDCGSEQQYDVRIRWAPVRVMNADGEDRQEILVGDTLYDDFRGSAPWTRIGQLPAGSLAPRSARSVALATDTASVAVMWSKHVDADDQGHEVTTYGQELAVYTQDLGAITRFRPVAQDGSDRIGFQAATLQVVGSKAGAPVLLPVNVDDDSLEVRRADDTHELVFTQPIVIAALAAPPCQTGIGQNTDACVTSYGTGSHEGIDGEIGASSSVSVSAGVKIDGAIFGEVQAKGTLSATARVWAGASYDLSKSVTYETGALEDAVVFATVPYDQYHYLTVSGPHAGEVFTVSMPRTPVVLIAERSFYNQAVTEGGLQIDDEVFQHTPGSVDSYAGPDAVTRLESTGVKVVEDGPMGVGQGASSVTLSHTVATDYSVGASLELGFQFDCEVSGGGVMAGFSVGISADASLSVTTGTSTTYSGTVGSIDAEHFADHFYEYGLYTYVQADPATKQKFEVLNWWVQK